MPVAAEPAPAELGTIRLAELLRALSYALDMTEGQPAGHCVRCCWIGTHLGRRIGLSEADQTSLYYTLLLKDLGCSSNAARICQLYITDDVTFKRDFKLVGDGLPQALRFVLTHSGLKAGLAARFRVMLEVIRNGGEHARELIETRCQRGADIARQMRFSEAVAQGIRDLDEHWDGNGKPQGLKGEDISVLARIALLAQVVDVFHMSGGPEQARAEVRRRSGTWFDPALVEAFEAAAAEPGFWHNLKAGWADDAVFGLSPAQRIEAVDDDYLDDIAAAFADVIDAKSPYTNGHSSRVAEYTDLIAAQMGLSGERRRWLRRAALLHDIGKLGVSNQILDKPGKLEPEEWAAMREHPAYGETILSRINAFSELARVAGAHHERLDGKGYPRGITADAIDRETRIVSAADVFDALTADRPYRPAMPVQKALAIMAEGVGAQIDRECFAALQAALKRQPPAALHSPA